MSRKKIYNLKEFKEGKIAIHCKDQRAYNKLMQRLEKAGFRVDYLKDCWKDKDTCICYGFFVGNLPIGYSSKSFYKEQGYTIIKPHEINLIEAKPKYTIEDLKTKKIAVHLPTKEEFYKMLEFLKDKNVSSERLKGVYSIRKERMCVQIAKYKNQYGYVEKVEYDSKEYYEEQGYTIITLDQILPEEYPDVKEQVWGMEHLLTEMEGDKPTAEDTLEKTDVTLLGIEPLDITVTLSDDYPKVTVKYQGKEKVITRDDFEDLGYAKNIFNPPVEEITKQYKMLSVGDQITINDIMQGLLKLRAECFDEPKKTMTLREAMNTGKKVKFKDEILDFSEPAGTWFFCKRPVKEYQQFLNNFDRIVEIIKE